MTNGEKYKTAQERAEAFNKFCKEQKSCRVCPSLNDNDAERGCSFRWLDLEAEEEKLLPCPFCGKKCNVIDFHTPIGFRYRIMCIQCTYSSMQYKTIDDAIAAHNRVAKAVKESEVAK